MKTYQALWRIICFRPGLYLLTYLSILAVSLGYQVPGLVYREVFNYLSGDAPARFDFWTAIAFLAVAGAVRIVGQYGSFACHIPFMFSTVALTQKNMLAHLFKRPGARALEEAPGEAVNRFRDDVIELQQVPWWLHQLLNSALLAGMALGIMLSIDAFITVTVFAPVTLVVVVAYAASRRIARYREANREATGEVSAFIGEIFGAVQSIKVAGAEGKVVDHFRRLNAARSRAALRDRLLQELFNSMSSNTARLGTGVILLLAGRSMRAGDFTVGDFALFAYYLGIVTDLPQLLGTTVALYKQAGVSLRRIGHLLQDAPAGTLVRHGPVYLGGELPEVPYTPKGESHKLEELRVSGLSYRYPGSDNGIAGIDLQLERGSFTVVTGRIGAGKTTLLQAVQGLLPRDAGEILWNGEKVEDPASFFAPPRSAYTAQLPWLFSAALRENILMGLPEEQIDLPGAMRAAALERDVEELEAGLFTVVGPRGVKLSGGQVQRAAAARMFVRQPELMIFDDLSSALDVETEQLLWQRLLARREATCLVVSHRQPVLQRADRIVVLKEGRVEAVGSLDVLLEECEEMQRLWAGSIGERD